MAALPSPFNEGQIHLRLTPLFFVSEKKGPLVHALLHLDSHDLAFAEEPDGSRKAVLNVVMMSYGDNGAPARRKSVPQASS